MTGGDKVRTMVKIVRFDLKNLLKYCLKPLESTLKKQRPMYVTKNLKFHHDNARLHVHKDVKKCLESEKEIC